MAGMGGTDGPDHNDPTPHDIHHDAVIARRARRWRVRRLARVLGMAAGVLLLGTCVLLGVRLAAMHSRVTAQFENLARNEYHHLLAAPFHVRVGTDARACGIVGRLQRAGYTRVEARPDAGCYRVQRGRITFRRAPGLLEAGTPYIVLDLEGPVVSRITVDGERADGVDLPPEHLTSFRTSLRERRTPVTLGDVPRDLLRAILAAEDRRFFDHPGLDVRGIGRALWRNVRERRVVEGGSTISQQVVKQILRRRGRSLPAKLDEALLALWIESRFSKADILQVYCNEVYFGQEGPFEIHGVAEAARFLFGKPLVMLSPEEKIQLAASIRAPNAASPRRNPERLRPYAAAIRAAMPVVDFPDSTALASRQAQRSRAWRFVRTAATRRTRVDLEETQAGYYFDRLEREWRNARQRFRLDRPAVLVTAFDPVLQGQAARSLRRGLRDAARQARHDDGSALVLEGAVVVLDPRDGAVRALVGGHDYATAPFNRALDARRPVGSTFKPIVYLAAMGGTRPEEHLSQSTWLPDEPRTYRVGRQSWQPANFDDTYRGWVTAREALALSVNAATVALGMDVGIEPVARLARNLGLQDRVPANPSILLGAVETSPLRVATAYAAIANGGVRVDPHALVAIHDGTRHLQPWDAPEKRVLDARVAYVVTDMLVGTLRSGTGRSAARYGFQHLATGKTGTTDGTRDAWFAGFTPELVSAVWVGCDDNRPTGLTGARAALPIWSRLMRDHLGEGWDADFEPPPGVVFRRIDPTTGGLANRTCPRTAVAAFVAGTEPTYGCDEHPATWQDRRDRISQRDGEAARRQRWLGVRPKRGFWARLKDALGV